MFFSPFVLFVIAAVESEVIASKTIELRSGEDAVLPCNLAPSYDMQGLRVEWTRDGKEVHLYREGNDDLRDQDKSFKGRTSLFREEITGGNISLKLSNATAEDSGIYTCYVKVKNLEHFKQCSIVLNSISTGAIAAIAVIIVIGAGVGLFLLVNKRKIKMCSGQIGGQQSMEENIDVRMNLNNTRNDDPAN
ncbi:V-set domain-containing T-cell activation inhibitor 1 [Collichthys lucidus]|uniref:V-set domain-containing T-cell activation inhibitor 1 n=1 Tax=Collichthys lucidus TaxID=240159 RepID=A0A4U5VUS5_COLLU|nr:V-set domain-containing T-cell activation inhibitor 1 [Collichthys lucidus]